MFTGTSFNRNVAIADVIASPAFCAAVVAVIAVLIGLGLRVDWRRTRRPLELAAPLRARAVLAVAVVGWVGWVAMERQSGDLCAATIIAPLLFVAVDRIAGPAWVIGRELRHAWSRRGWVLHEVLEIDDHRVLLRDPSGTSLRARTELPLELGSAYVDLEALPSPRAEPYRGGDAVSASVRQLETTAVRAARAHGIATAAVALLSGLMWLALPFFHSLARAVVR